MTTDRPYSKGMELGAALDRIRSFIGTRYDGAVVEALIHACETGEVRPVGGLVKPKPQTEADDPECMKLFERRVA